MTTNNDLKLDHEQEAVARWHPSHGHLKVTAGAGTGKTRTAVNLVARLLLEHGYPTNRVCVLTFTRKAADELASRLTALVSAAAVQSMWMGTFHRVGLAMLRELNTGPWEMSKCLDMDAGTRTAGVPSALNLFRSIVCFGTIPGLKDRESLRLADQPDEYIRAIELQRAAGLRLATMKPVKGLQLSAVWALYDEAKNANGWWDFNDVLEAWYDALEPYTKGFFQAVVVDEAQDNNAIQAMIVQRLVGDEGKIVLIGDERQTIHVWRGAHPEIFARADTTLGAKKLELRNNYRSSEPIVAVCNRFATGKPWTLGLPAVSTRPGGPKPLLVGLPSDYDEGVWAAGRIRTDLRNGIRKSRAVLCRTNGGVAAFEAAFIAVGVPVTVLSGRSLFASIAATRVLEYLRAFNRDDPHSAVAVANVPKRFISKSLLHTFSNMTPLAGESMGKRLRRACDITRLPARSMQNVLPFCDLLDTGAKSSWAEQISLVRETLRQVEEVEGREPQDADDAAVSDAVLTVASRCVDYNQFEQFTDLVVKSGHVNHPDAVVLATIHRVKGMEFDEVFVDVTNGRIPHARAEPAAIPEEERLLYVAMSRARDRLYLIYTSPAEDYNEDGEEEQEDEKPAVLDTAASMRAIIARARAANQPFNSARGRKSQAQDQERVGGLSRFVREFRNSGLVDIVPPALVWQY